MKAVVFTLGCKVNESESEGLIAGLIEKGYEVSDRLEYADLYIVNTCAVTKEAEKKSRQMASRITKLNPNAKIIFTGCATQKGATAFLGKKNVSLVTGTFSKDKILENIDFVGEKIYDMPTEFEEMPPIKTLKTRAFIKVQDGCNNFCSYCIIPYLRGRTRSRNPENIIKEIKATNPVEVILNGINLSAYNYNGLNLAGLVNLLKDFDCRIRLGSLEVNVITEELLTALKGLKNFAKHFHLSLQAGSNKVLKDMNRHYSREQFIEKVNLIRSYFPSAGITTDIIVGYPTETEEDFNLTLDLIEKVEFSDIHPFIFSPREGTKAYKLKDLDYAIKKARLDILLEKKAKCKEEFILGQLNKEEYFIFEESKNGYKQGYSGNYIRLYIREEDFLGNGNVVLVKPYEDGANIEYKGGEN